MLVGGIGVAVGVEVAFVGVSAAEAGALDLDADTDCEQAAVSYAPPGLSLISCRHPWLAPWAVLFRPFGACSTFPHSTQRLAPLHSFAPSELGIISRPDACVCAFEAPIPNLGSYFCCCDVGHGFCIHSIMKIGVGSRLSAREQRCAQRGHCSRHERSCEAAEECSPRRKAWVRHQNHLQPRRGERECLIPQEISCCISSSRPRADIHRSGPRFAMICSPISRRDCSRDERNCLDHQRSNGANDHVHMLIRVRLAHSASDIARVVKANSSRWVWEKHSAGFAWQTGYGVFSVSESTVVAVTKYIAEQEEHPKKRSFQEEFVVFLKKNRVEYDPKYIWD